MKSTKVVFVTGPNGAGKEWICENVIPITGVPHQVKGVSAMIKSAYEIPESERKRMKQGKLVSDRYIESLVETNIRMHLEGDQPEGTLYFDGFPRNLIQAMYIINNFDPLTTAILHVDASKETCRQAMYRRIASGKGRADDNNPTFERRWKIYEENVLPAIRRLGEDFSVYTVYGGIGIPEEMKLAPILRMLSKLRVPLICDDTVSLNEICGCVKGCSHTTLHRFIKAHPKILKDCPPVWIRSDKQALLV